MNSNRTLTLSDLTNHLHPGGEPRRRSHAEVGKPCLVACALVCGMLVLAMSACGASSTSSTSPNRVVFDETVTSNLVTKPVILTGSQQTLAWTCSPAGGATHLISMGAAGSDPADAQPIFKGMCAMGGTSGSQTLHMPPGSYFLQSLPGGSWHIVLTDIDYSKTEATAIARNPQALVTPSPTPPPFSPTVGYQTAWGSHAATATYSLAIDATRSFAVEAVAPDGRTLLGGEWSPSGFQAGYFDPATRHFTAIGVSDGQDPVPCCLSNGHYLIAEDESIPGIPASPGLVRIWSYDLWTGHLRLVAGPGTIGTLALSHGMLIFASPASGSPAPGGKVLVANLAAGTIAPLSAGKDDSGIQVLAVSWPYLVYTALSSGGVPSVFRVRDLATGHDSPLPALGQFASSHPGIGPSVAYSIAGDTLLAAVPTNPAMATETNSYGETSTTAFYALAHVLSGGTQVTSLGSFTSQGSPGYTVADNTLYVSVLTGQVTDQSGLDVQNSGWTTFYAVGQITSGGTPPQMLGTFNGNALDIVGANSRVIACVGAAWDPTGQQLDSLPVFWDLATRTFVTFTPEFRYSLPPSQGPLFAGEPTGIAISLSGSDLVVLQENAVGQAVLFFDTSILPTTFAGG